MIDGWRSRKADFHTNGVKKKVFVAQPARFRSPSQGRTRTAKRNGRGHSIGQCSRRVVRLPRRCRGLDCARASIGPLERRLSIPQVLIDECADLFGAGWLGEKWKTS